MFVEAIRLVLNQDDHIDVLDIVDTGDAALTSIFKHLPDVAILDVTMPGPGPLRIAEEVAASNAPTRLIALTMHLDAGLSEVLLAGGYAGYVVKDTAVSELLQAIRQIHGGTSFVSEAVNALDDNRSVQNRLLTGRERECLQYAAEGLTNRAIGQRLGVAERTIKFHFENILRKLRASSRGEAVAIARRSAII